MLTLISFASAIQSEEAEIAALTFTVSFLSKEKNAESILRVLELQEANLVQEYSVVAGILPQSLGS